MTFFFTVLFFTALFSGGLAFLVSDVKSGWYKLSLVFAGAYLFAITVIHILPELFYDAENPTTIGIYVLLGFFYSRYWNTSVEARNMVIFISIHMITNNPFRLLFPSL